MTKFIINNQIIVRSTFAAFMLLLLFLTGEGAAVQEKRGETGSKGQTTRESMVADTPFDFDGDSKTDITVYRRTAGEYWQLNSSDGGNAVTTFGRPDNYNDYPIPDDYTGDGVTDKAFYRRETNEFFILRSEDNSFYSFEFGTEDDLPIVGDFDGDGSADPGVYRRPNTAGPATFYILLSSGGVRIEQFGDYRDYPVIEDFDGDGSDDLAIYRWNQAEWWIKNSSGGTEVFTFGIMQAPLTTMNDQKAENLGGGAYSVPIPSDYTGDGKADIAYYSSDGHWFILRSEDDSYYSFPFGSQGDYPVLGDYDGDGVTDPGVFRPSSNTWYLLQSSEGFRALAFGQNEDYPVSTYRIGTF